MACAVEGCPNVVLEGSVFCATHRVQRCRYKACRNAAAAGSDYCRAHKDGAANRRVGGDVVPAAKGPVDTTSAEFTRFKTRLDRAQAHVEEFLASDGFDAWAGLFFGAANVEKVRSVYAKMPEVFAEWKKGNAVGNFRIELDPMYALTSTPNSCDMATATLTVSPKFLSEQDIGQDWILIHEAAHASCVKDPALTQAQVLGAQIGDKAYHPGDGALFNNLSAALRLINADHYRWCIKTWKDKGAIDEEATRFGIQQPENLPANGQVIDQTDDRSTTAEKTYAHFIREGAYAVFKLAWLKMYNLAIEGNTAYHRGGATPGKMTFAQETRLKTALGGKKTDQMKDKDFVRLEDLYNCLLDWQGIVRDTIPVHDYDRRRKGAGKVQILKEPVQEGGNRIVKRFLVKSGYNTGARLHGPDLRAGVKQIIEIVLRERPYPKVTVKDVVRWAKDCHEQKPRWIRNWSV
jgi:hypothetical protein